MPTPVVYATCLTYTHFDASDLFDLAFILRSDEHTLKAVCLPEAGDGGRILDALTVRANAVGTVPYVHGVEGLKAMLQQAEEPVNLVVTAGYGVVAQLLAQDRALFRDKVARLFVVGGQANDYTTKMERLPIDPRLKERHPERFAATGDVRITSLEEQAALGALLTSGEGVIWLPRDICLWRYAAPHTLTDGGQVCEFLLRELYTTHLADASDRYAAADAPVLLSSLPALLLAVHPDPMAWMRHFRAIVARVEVDANGKVTLLETKPEKPNLYAVIAIDGRTLGLLLTKTLRMRPL